MTSNTRDDVICLYSFFLLLYADNTVLLAESENDMQHALDILEVYSPWASGGFAPPRGNFLDHNIIVNTGLWVRKMHVGTKIKGAFGDYGLLYQTASNRQKIRISSFKQL